VVVMKSTTVFCNVIACSPLKVDRRFGGTYRLHLHGERISLAIYQYERWQAELIDPEDGGDMFL
jgi:hypothetical protein